CPIRGPNGSSRRVSQSVAATRIRAAVSSLDQAVERPEFPLTAWRRRHTLVPERLLDSLTSRSRAAIRSATGPPETKAGPGPQRRPYLTHASFSDPDANGWLLQEITERLPGR
ncbi:MAG: hypothetical protein M3M99_07750, partial [Actinomycetota bacterium]|nr:hypothetical protein [Actinomycetota bacterium]